MRKTASRDFEALRQITITARHVYETAQALMSQALERAEAERRQTLAQADQRRQQAEQALAKDRARTASQQERAADLLGAIQAVCQAAVELLQQAGLAYIMEAPLDAQSPQPDQEQWTAEIASRFAAVQTAFADLKESLRRLAVAYIEAANWEGARRVLTALLAIDQEDQDSAILLRESYYRPATQAFGAGRWAEACQELQSLLKIDKSYRDARALLAESYYRHAAEALEAGQWSAARQALGALLALDPTYKDAGTLLRQSHYRAAMQAFKAERWAEARQELVTLLEIDKDDQEALSLLRETYERSAEAYDQAIKSADISMALRPWDSGLIGQQRLAALYQKALHALSFGQWAEALECADRMKLVSPSDPRIEEIRQQVVNSGRV